MSKVRKATFATEAKTEDHVWFNVKILQWLAISTFILVVLIYVRPGKENV